MHLAFTQIYLRIVHHAALVTGFMFVLALVVRGVYEPHAVETHWEQSRCQVE